MSAKQPPRRRRIAGESKPGDVATPTPPIELTKPIEPVEPVEEIKRPKLAKPKLPKREKPAVASPASDLPAAPPRAESMRVPRAKPSSKLIALLALTVASLAFGVCGVMLGINEWRSNNIGESRLAATDAAASAAEKIFTYQYNKLPEHQRQAEATMTPKFAKKFRSISPALSALAPQRKIQVKAVVRQAAGKECGEDCSADKATALIFIDQARVADSSSKPTVFGNRIEVSMVERNGKWLVDDIKAL